jgi:hypothetical protein
MTHVLPGKTVSKKEIVTRKLLASEKMSLTDRYPVKSVSDVFKDNILLTLGYMSGRVQSAGQINWDELHKPTSFAFTLKPGEVFSFTDSEMAQFKDKTVLTTKAHFTAFEGFRSDGYLYGDGVCHFASLMNWAARGAGLEVTAPVRHDFAAIPEIAPVYGTAIYYSPDQPSVNEQQNLYIENTLSIPVQFVFIYKDDTLQVNIYK